MSGDFGVIAQSTDGGMTWTSNNFLLTTALMLDIQEVPNTSTVVAVGRQRTIPTRQVLRSTDMGDTWSVIDVPVNTDLQAVSFVDSQLGYACGTNSQVVKTTDAGLTWAPVTRPSTTNFTLQALEFSDANTGWFSSILPVSPVVTSSKQPTAGQRGVSKLLEPRTRSLPVTW
jgi:photosystem II stability/assembly factor-like uncharacterized protein